MQSAAKPAASKLQPQKDSSEPDRAVKEIPALTLPATSRLPPWQARSSTVRYFSTPPTLTLPRESFSCQIRSPIPTRSPKFVPVNDSREPIKPLPDLGAACQQIRRKYSAMAQSQSF